MGSFLKARAQELVGGGLLLIQLPGVPNGALFVQTGEGMTHALLGSCLQDMANAGMTSKAKLESFNLPQYHPSMDVLEMLVVMNKCFSIQRMGKLSHPMKHMPPDIEATCSETRAVLEGLIARHFDTHIVDHLLHVFASKLEDNRSVFDNNIRRDAHFFILLKRKLA